jgi:hypothetical protein
MQPTAVIQHPNLDGVSVTVQRPRGAERHRMLQARERACTRAVAVTGLDDRIITRLDGSAQSVVLSFPTPVEQTNAELKKYIVGMAVRDADGVTHNYPFERAKDFEADRARLIDDGLFWDDHLECEISAWDMIPYAPDANRKNLTDDEIEALKEMKRKMPFARWIILVSEVPTTFDADPQGKR